MSGQRVAGGGEVFVTDDGVGILPGDRGRIFEMFERGRASHRSPGRGLGLAICREIVESHGGRIWVEDAPGGGSRFGFFLPDPS